MLESLFIIFKYLFLNFSREIMLSKAINVPQNHLNRSQNFHYRSNYQSHFHDRSKHSLHVLRMKRLEYLHSAVKKLLVDANDKDYLWKQKIKKVHKILSILIFTRQSCTSVDTYKYDRMRLLGKTEVTVLIFL